MIVKIKFFPCYLDETTLPLISLTKSRNGKTGTATFIFIRPTIFYQNKFNNPIQGMSLLWENKEIKTNDITILFNKGKPFLIKTIFIFKNSNDWFNFLNFMQYFSKETGLAFEEKNPKVNFRK